MTTALVPPAPRNKRDPTSVTRLRHVANHQRPLLLAGSVRAD